MSIFISIDFIQQLSMIFPHNWTRQVYCSVLGSICPLVPIRTVAFQSYCISVVWNFSLLIILLESLFLRDYGFCYLFTRSFEWNTLPSIFLRNDQEIWNIACQKIFILPSCFLFFPKVNFFYCMFFPFVCCSFSFKCKERLFIWAFSCFLR